MDSLKGGSGDVGIIELELYILARPVIVLCKYSLSFAFGPLSSGFRKPAKKHRVKEAYRPVSMSWQRRAMVMRGKTY